MPSGKLSVALIQMIVSASKEANIQRACQLITESAEKGAKLICLPECFNSPYGLKYFAQYAESIPGETSKALSNVAKKHQIYLIGGSIPERSDDKLYNTCLAFGPDGQILATYRKTHLFDIDIPGKITFQESKALSPGNSLAMIDTPFLKIGIGICYDLRFPLLAGVYADRGCHLLIYPGAFNMTTGPAHWELLQRARAVDNQVFVATISPARDDSSSYVAWGHSSVIDPWGTVVAKAEEGETVVHAEIDVNELEDIRQKIPVTKQKRDDLYKLIHPCDN